MSKEKINSILLVNNYLICCKVTNCNPKKTDLVRKYLIQKLNKILFKS